MTKVTKKYQRLRRRLREYDIDQKYLAELLKRSTSYVNNCFGGKGDWQMQEVYTIAKLCQIPVEEIHKYFPPDGIDIKDSEPDPASKFASDLADLLQKYIKEAARA